MRAAEAYWQGREGLFEQLIERSAPSCYDISAAIKAGMVKDPGAREGFAWKTSVLKTIDQPVAHFSAWRAAMEVETVAVEAARKSEEAIQKLRDAADKFRGVVKNDLTSMKAASDRVQTEVTQMRDQYTKVQAILTSPDFQMAVSNAERLATALEAIHKLQGQRIGFALFSGEEKKQ